MPITNPYPNRPIWIGSDYDNPANPLHGGLIVLESFYGENPGDPQWIHSFYEKCYPDRTFADLFRCMEARHPIRPQREVWINVSGEVLKQWFNQFAFYNFVYWSLGPDNSVKPTTGDFERAADGFDRLLADWQTGSQTKGHLVSRQESFLVFGTNCRKAQHPFQDRSASLYGRFQRL